MLGWLHSAAIMCKTQLVIVMQIIVNRTRFDEGWSPSLTWGMSATIERIAASVSLGFIVQLVGLLLASVMIIKTMIMVYSGVIEKLSTYLPKICHLWYLPTVCVMYDLMICVYFVQLSISKTSFYHYSIYRIGSVSWRQTWQNHDNLRRLTVYSRRSWGQAKTLTDLLPNVLVRFMLSI